MTRILSIALLLGLAVPAQAQLAEPGDKERYIGLFFFRPEDAEWVGAVSSRGTWTHPSKNTPPVRWDVTWQFDYGTFGAKRVTPTSVAPAKETDASKNSGSYTFNVWQGRVTRFVDWRLEAAAGLEHKRVHNLAEEGIAHVTGAIARLGGVASASKAVFVDRQVCGGPAAVAAAQLDYRLAGAVTTAKAVTAAGESQEKFTDATAEVWLSVWPAVDEGDCKTEPTTWHRIVLAASGVASAGFGDVPNTSSVDASVSLFVTPKVGFRLRRFAGYFDHNLRDRKNATTAMLVVKF